MSKSAVKSIFRNQYARVVYVSQLHFSLSWHRNNPTAASNPMIGGNAGVSGGHVLAASSAASTNATSRGEELRQVRLRQQEIANQRAQEAAKLRKEKEAQEKDRKNHVAKKRPTGGDTLGKGSSAASRGGGYNALQPWSSQSSGYR